MFSSPGSLAFTALLALGVTCNRPVQFPGVSFLQVHRAVSKHYPHTIGPADSAEYFEQDHFLAVEPPLDETLSDSGSDEALALRHVRVDLDDDGQRVSVRLDHQGKPLLYQMSVFSVYSAGAEVSVRASDGSRQSSESRSRHFRSREQGKWASMALSESGQVSGIFEVEGSLLEVSPANVSNGQQARAAAPCFAQISAGALHKVRQARLPDLRNQNMDSTLGLSLAELTSARADWNGDVWWPGCYKGDSELHVFTMRGIADPAAWEARGSALQDDLEYVVSQTSFVFEHQLNIRLELSSLEIHQTLAGAPSYITGCEVGMRSMHREIGAALRDSALPFEGAVHMITGCTGEGFELGGLAWIGNNMNGYGICNKNGYNTGISKYYGQYWQTFAHELGHNFGGFHSFEEGQGQTGGLMDYGDGRLNGVYQFNTKHRKAEMCALVDSRVSQCGDNFKISGPTPAPTPAPPASCDDCRSIGSVQCLWTDGKCYPMSQAFCSSQDGAQYCDGAQTTTAFTTTTMSSTTGATTITTATTTVTTVTETTITTTIATTTSSAAVSSTTVPAACGACTQWNPCLWTDGTCYPMSREMCSAGGVHYCDSSDSWTATTTSKTTTTTTTTTTRIASTTMATTTATNTAMTTTTTTSETTTTTTTTTTTSKTTTTTTSKTT